MPKKLAVSGFEVLAAPLEAALKVPPEASPEAAEPSPEVRARSAAEIAEAYGVSDRTVQTWFKTVCAAYCWIEPETLKTGRSAKTRYTPLCQTLIAEYRAVAVNQSEEDWIAAVHAAHPEKLPNPPAPPKQAEVPLSPTEVVSDRFGTCDHGGGLTLHLGAELSLPAIAAIVAPGNDTAYLEQIQQRLDQFEVFQQQTIAQMHEQFEQAKSLNVQYQEAMSLSDQLLLKEFQLKGVQLGYTAISLKQEAFKATVQAAEAGTLPVPGKPQGETEPLQSV